MSSMLGNSMYKDQIPFETEWNKAHPTVLRLLKQQNVNKLEWQDLFCIVYNIHSWVHEGAAQVREALSADIAQYVSDTHQRISCKTEEFDLLNIYIEEWNRFYTQTNILPLPFKVIENTDDMHPLNRSERSSSLKNRPVKEVMLNSWNQTIFTSISQKLLRAAEKLLDQERNGESFNASLVIGVRESFVALNEDTSESEDKLGVYRNTFEKSYIESTSDYYKKRASEYLLNYGVISYMLYADKKLEEEENRARKYLDPNPESIGKLVESCVQILVIEFEEQILAVCPGLIERNDVEKLQMLYRLVKRTPTGIEIILKCIDEHIRHEGLNDMKNNAETITVDPEKYVTQLLCLFEKFSALVKNGFCDDARLLTARDKAFREIINDTTIFKMELPVTNNKKSRNVAVESKCPELLANYCDLLLRKTQLSKKLSSEEIDEKLNHLLMVLKYVTNKDVFMRFHKAHLSRRLILDMSADQEKEEAVVNRLREAGMPAEHVNKLSRMLQDIELNKDINNTFKKHLMTNLNTKADSINLKVLNGGAWGRGGLDKVWLSLPRELEDFVPEVEAFYKKQHNGRKLNWMHHWSNGTVIFGTNSGGKFDLEVTTFQMAILFAFDEKSSEKLSLETLRLATELPDTELIKTLYSLVSYPKMKSQILLCDSRSPLNPRDFNDSTEFWVNHGFHLIKNGKPQNRGRINLIGRLQLSIEPNATKEHEDIVALREFRVQEAVVKIMKMRKVITLAQLQTELVEMLKPMFLPNRKLIKEQIDWLIDNKFIERSDGDMNIFKYIS